MTTQAYVNNNQQLTFPNNTLPNGLNSVQKRGYLNGLSIKEMGKSMLAGACANVLYLMVDPIGVTQLTSSYITPGEFMGQKNQSILPIILAGGMVGITANIINKVIQNRAPAMREAKIISNVVAGTVAPAMITAATAICFPAFLGPLFNVAPGLHLNPLIIAGTAAMGGIGGALMAPVGIASAWYGDSDSSTLEPEQQKVQSTPTNVSVA